jgi:hypothetical protein
LLKIKRVLAEGTSGLRTNRSLLWTAVRSVGLSAPCDQNPPGVYRKTVADVLRDHVTLEVEGIDRMYLNVSVPQWQRELGLVGFLRNPRGHLFATSWGLQDP